MGPLRFKVCCIASPAEAEVAIAAGASALGLVSTMPSGPGVIDEPMIAEIAARIPPGIASFLLTALTEADAIIEQHRRCRTTTLQLVDRVEPAVHRQLRQALPGIGLVQVIHVLDESSVDEACELAPSADALLLDSGNPKLPIKSLGGTGQIHDWRLSRRIVARCGKPVWLAGGLTTDNLATAVKAVRPFGVDLCSSVRVASRLDREQLQRFASAVHGARQ